MPKFAAAMSASLTLSGMGFGGVIILLMLCEFRKDQNFGGEGGGQCYQG